MEYVCSDHACPDTSNVLREQCDNVSIRSDSKAKFGVGNGQINSIADKENFSQANVPVEPVDCTFRIV
jgi:hypothetical protein